MPDAPAAPLLQPSRTEPGAQQQGPGIVTELKSSAYLMTLDRGLFCIQQGPRPAGIEDGSGLPGVRVSLPPGPDGRPEAVTIRTFRDDGWLAGGEAALVRVSEGPAQVLVTVYQSPSHAPQAAPRLHVQRLGQETAAVARPGGAAPAQSPGAAAAPVDVVAHVSHTGDVGARLGEWVGAKGSGNAIEGFAIAPREGVAPEDIEYQAVLGRGWLSPWMQGGQFCGSRGMALPLLGLRVRLRGRAAETHTCTYRASFVDGPEVGPVPEGEACETDDLHALEAFQVALTPKLGLAPPRGTPRVLRSAKRS